MQLVKGFFLKMFKKYNSSIAEIFSKHKMRLFVTTSIISEHTINGIYRNYVGRSKFNFTESSSFIYIDIIITTR